MQELDDTALISLILELHEHDTAEPISRLPGLWERQIDERWTIWVNGHMKPLNVSKPGHASAKVLPGDCYATFNGWPAGCFSIITGQGIIALGSEGNMKNLCAAIRKAIGGSNGD